MNFLSKIIVILILIVSMGKLIHYNHSVNESQNFIIKRLLANNKETLSILLVECRNKEQGLDKNICGMAYSAEFYRKAKSVQEQSTH